MGTYVAKNGYIYLQVQHNKDTIKFSLRTKDQDVADHLYEKFLERFIEVKLDGKLSKKKGQGITASIPIIPSSPALAEIKPSKIAEHSVDKYYGIYLSAFQSGAKEVAVGTIKTKELIRKMLKESGIILYSDFNQENINKLNSTMKAAGNEGPTKNKYFNQIRAFLNWSIKKAPGDVELFTEKQYNRLEFPRFEETSRDVYIPIEHRDLINKTILSEIGLCDNKINQISRTGQKNYKAQATLRKFEGKRAELVDLKLYLSCLYNLVCRPNEPTAINAKTFNLQDKTARIWMNKTQKFKTILLTDNDFISTIKGLKEDEDGFFLRGHGKSEAFYSSKFKDILKVSGLENENYFLYAYRHTAITDLMILSKGNASFVANQAGDNEDMIRKHYDHSTILQKYSHYLDK